MVILEAAAIRLTDDSQVQNFPAELTIFDLNTKQGINLNDFLNYLCLNHPDAFYSTINNIGRVPIPNNFTYESPQSEEN